MPQLLKPLFRPETLHEALRGFTLPQLATARAKLAKQAHFLNGSGARRAKESTLFPAFFADVFGELLGYIQPAQADHLAIGSPASASHHYTFFPNYTTPKGELADAAIGPSPTQGQPGTVTAVVEMKGPTDPLDIPHAGRRLSAVEQAFGYAIDIPCDWIIVSSMVETRLYSKRADRLSCERFLISDLANQSDDGQLRKFVFLLHASRVVPAPSKRSHLDQLLDTSRETGRRVTNKFYEEYAQMREHAFSELALANPAIPRPAVLSSTQKLLDRILFCAFAEDRGLLPANTIAHAFSHANPYDLEQRPKWHNFRALFRSIDLGNAALQIAKYNGGLFEVDDLLDNQIAVPDSVCDVFRRLGEYEYAALDAADRNFPDSPAPAGFLDVEILGHIFEQSITDLERLRERLDGNTPANGNGEPPVTSPAHAEAVTPKVTAKKPKTSRKQQGAFYTPAYITRFIVQQALGSVLADRFEALRARAHATAKATSRKPLEDPRAYDLGSLNAPQREALVQFWSDWREELKFIRIVDPACGSGAFLIEAFDQLLAQYQSANAHYAALAGQEELFDLNRLILQQNLYGVDLNAEAVEICRLSLWIKTAEKGKILADLDHNIRVGNSLIDDPAFAPGKAFRWPDAFPEVFADGGFDVVVGNPPYIRQEWIAPIKPYLKARYQVFSGTADLYLYFVEKALQALRPGGRVGFITSGTFARAAAATEYRNWLPSAASFECVVNLGETMPFGVDTWVFQPTMFVLQKGGTKPEFPTLFIHDTLPPSLDESVITDALTCDNASVFAHTEWKFQPHAVTELFSKLMATGRSLREACDGHLYYGIKTGFNAAFIIDQPTRDRLVLEDAHSTEILKKVLKGEDLRPWYQDWDGHWLVFTRRGINIAEYPAVLRYLEGYREQLEPRPDNWKGKSDSWPGRKPGSYKWYEVQDSIDYYAQFDMPKIFWPEMGKYSRFSYDAEAFYVNNKGFFALSPSIAILPVLQSRISWFLIGQMCSPLRLRAGLWESQQRMQEIERLRIPEISRDEVGIFTAHANETTCTARERRDLQKRIAHRIQTDLAPAGAALNNALTEWWTLDFRTLQAELQKVYKRTIPLADRDAWQSQLETWKREHENLTHRLIDAEEEINDRVYHLFNLTPQEVRTLEDFQKTTRTYYPLGST